MTLMEDEKQAYCSETVYGAGGWSDPCSRKAKLERDGKPYCTQHDPERVAERRAKQHAKWKEQNDEALEASVVANLLKACEGFMRYLQQELIPNVRSVEGGQALLDAGWQLVADGHILVAKAKGVSP